MFWEETIKDKLALQSFVTFEYIFKYFNKFCHDECNIYSQNKCILKNRKMKTEFIKHMPTKGTC